MWGGLVGPQVVCVPQWYAVAGRQLRVVTVVTVIVCKKSKPPTLSGPLRKGEG